jgi:hypothetical protein
MLITSLAVILYIIPRQACLPVPLPEIPRHNGRKGNMEIFRARGPLIRLIQMEARVRRSERKLAPPRDLKGLEPDDVAVFPTSAPNRAEYASLSSLMLLDHIEELQLDPGLIFADLGSGLGAACFAASTYFKEVHGFEYDPRLAMEAERLREGLGFNNVVFHQGDFLKADLSKYGVLYFFHPFRDNFVPLMAKRMENISSGTYVISQVFNYARPSIFTERLFERIHPVEIGEDEVGDDLITELITFRRR